MTTSGNSLNAEREHAHDEKKLPSSQDTEIEIAVNSFIKLYNTRAKFFADTFIKKVREGNRKALSELQRHALPPSVMDLRQEFAKCLKAHVPDTHKFQMADGKVYTKQDLKKLVSEWSSVAENALMQSDPALADKLMSPAQWNAKSAFEVAFVTAMNELKDIRKTRQVSGTADYYTKWIINPLKKATEQVRAVNPPSNSLIGYGDRIPLAEAMEEVERLQSEFLRILHKING
jgi:hypothetical protein